MRERLAKRRADRVKQEELEQQQTLSLLRPKSGRQSTADVVAKAMHSLPVSVLIVPVGLCQNIYRVLLVEGGGGFSSNLWIMAASWRGGLFA